MSIITEKRLKKNSLDKITKKLELCLYKASTSLKLTSFIFICLILLLILVKSLYMIIYHEHYVYKGLLSLKEQNITYNKYVMFLIMLLSPQNNIHNMKPYEPDIAFCKNVLSFICAVIFNAFYIDSLSSLLTNQKHLYDCRMVSIFYSYFLGILSFLLYNNIKHSVNTYFELQASFIMVFITSYSIIITCVIVGVYISGILLNTNSEPERTQEIPLIEMSNQNKETSAPYQNDMQEIPFIEMSNQNKDLSNLNDYCIYKNPDN